MDSSSNTTSGSQETQTNPPKVRRALFSGEHNDEKFNNPFHDCDDEATRDIAKRVALEYSLTSPEWQELFTKAVMVLKYPNPMHWRTFTLPQCPPLSAGETSALKNERFTSFWDQPWPLKTTFLMLFVAAIVQGWSQTGTNGANLGIPGAFGWNTTSSSSFDGSSNHTEPTTRNCTPAGTDGWKFATLNAAPYLFASVACWISDPLNELVYGRRGAIAISALLVLGSSIGAAFTEGHWEYLFACRALLGIGMGCKAAVVPVFAAEIAPAHLRGTLVMNWQVFDALGIFLGFTANLIASTAGPSAAWRWQVSSSCIPAFALLWGTLYICWDSPRFLMKKEKKYREKYDELVEMHDAVMKIQLEKHERQQQQQEQGRGGKTSVNIELERADQRSRPTEQIQPQPQLDQIVVPKWLYRSRFFPMAVRQHCRPSMLKPYTSPAFDTLLLLRGHPILAAKELLFAHCQLLIELQQDSAQSSTASTDEYVDFSLESKTTWLTRVGHLFPFNGSQFAYIRREALAAATVMFSQQLCGINVLIFYSATLFCNAGTGKESSASLDPLLLSWGLGGINFIGAFPAYKWIEKLGRQWLLLATLPLLSLFSGLAALGFGLTDESSMQRKAVVVAFTFAFTAVYSFGMGPVPFTYSAEIFPLEHRMVGMSFAVSVNMLGAGALALFVPKISPPWILLTVFTGLNILAWCCVWRFVREVAGIVINNREGQMTALHMEQLIYIFRIPTYLYKRYQRKIYWPYFLNTIKNIFLGRLRPILQPAFYSWGYSIWRQEQAATSGTARQGS